MGQILFSRGRFNVIALTKNEANRTGHIAWIEEKDRKKAIRAMKGAVEKAPFNCAVWVNANETLTEDMKSKLQEWRKDHSLDIYTHNDYKSAHAAKSSADAAGRLREEFRRKAIPFLEPAQYLRDHMIRRTRDIFNAMGVKSLSLQLRARCSDMTNPCFGGHTDGPGPGSNIRLLESLISMGTQLIANNDAIPGTDSENAWKLKPEGTITCLQPPENSLILITDQTHPWQPILHDSPMGPPEEPRQPRIVLCYDIVLK
jgi:hypothetical protein